MSGPDGGMKRNRFVSSSIRTEPGPTEIHSRWSSNSWPSGPGLLRRSRRCRGPVSRPEAPKGSVSGRSSVRAWPASRARDGGCRCRRGLGARVGRRRARLGGSRLGGLPGVLLRRLLPGSDDAAQGRARAVAASGVRRHRPAGDRLDGGDAGHARDHHGEAGQRDLAPGQVPAARRATALRRPWWWSAATLRGRPFATRAVWRMRSAVRRAASRLRRSDQVYVAEPTVAMTLPAAAPIRVPAVPAHEMNTAPDIAASALPATWAGESSSLRSGSCLVMILRTGSKTGPPVRRARGSAGFNPTG